MRLFYLKTNLPTYGNAVLFKGEKNYDRIYRYVRGEIGAEALPAQITGSCQDGVSAQDLVTLDYLHAYGNIPIFSPALAKLTASVAAQEVEFYPVTIRAQTASASFFLTVIKHRVQLVDDNTIAAIADKNYLAGTRFKSDVSGEFMLAREANPLCSEFVVAEKFKRLTQQHKLNIAFKEVRYSP